MIAMDVLFLEYYQDLLVAKPEESMDFIRPFEASSLQSSATTSEHRVVF